MRHFLWKTARIFFVVRAGAHTRWVVTKMIDKQENLQYLPVHHTTFTNSSMIYIVICDVAGEIRMTSGTHTAGGVVTMVTDKQESLQYLTVDSTTFTNSSMIYIVTCDVAGEIRMASGTHTAGGVATMVTDKQESLQYLTVDSTTFTNSSMIYIVTCDVAGEIRMASGTHTAGGVATMVTDKQESLQYLTVDSTTFLHWRTLARAHSLHNDSDMAAFLLQQSVRVYLLSPGGHRTGFMSGDCLSCLQVYTGQASCLVTVCPVS